MPGRAVRLELRRAVVVGALVVPACQRVVVGIGRRLRDRARRRIAAARPCPSATTSRGTGECRAGVAHAAQAGEPRRRRPPAENLEPGEIQLAVGGIHRAVQRRKIERARDADHRRLRLRSARSSSTRNSSGLLKPMCTSASFERPHACAEQPDLRHRRRVGRVRNPRQRLGDGRRIDFARQLVAEEAVELPVAHDVQRRARNVVALLIAGE